MARASRSAVAGERLLPPPAAELTHEQERPGALERHRQTLEQLQRPIGRGDGSRQVSLGGQDHRAAPGGCGEGPSPPGCRGLVVETGEDLAGLVQLACRHQRLDEVRCVGTQSWFVDAGLPLQLVERPQVCHRLLKLTA